MPKYSTKGKLSSKSKSEITGSTRNKKVILKVPEKSAVSKLQMVAPKSKRVVLLSTTQSGEVLTIFSPEKKMEFQVEWGIDGPVIRMNVSQIEFIAEKTIDMRCSKFKLHANEGIELQSGAGLNINSEEIRAKTTKSIHLDGEKIRLNSPEEEDLPLPQLPESGFHSGDCKH